jgi:hypothetical protein
MSDTRTIWKQRIASWRASGESAERFAAGRGFAGSTLKWWASQLREESPARVVRVAQIVRSPGDPTRARERGTVVVEGLDARVRITIEPGADRETVQTVLAFVCSSQDRR